MHIILAELYNSSLHGDPYLDGHYLVVGKFDPYTYKLYDDFEYGDEDEDDGDEPVTINTISVLYRLNYDIIINSSSYPHNIIRNYDAIVRSDNYLTPQLAECIILPTQETIAIIKTIWIKIIQRVWKKIYNNRKKLLHNLIITNKFQLHANIIKQLPGIRGMLSNLVNKN
jgi:hypothetical protein